MAIRDLSKKLSNKPSRDELDNYLKFKPNSDEIFKAINNLGDKYNINSCLQCLANIKSITDYLLNEKT